MAHEKYSTPGTPEREFIRHVTTRVLNKLTVFEIILLRAHFQSEPEYERVVKTLKEQQRDNPALMDEILGPTGAAMLRKIES